MNEIPEAEKFVEQNRVNMARRKARNDATHRKLKELTQPPTEEWAPDVFSRKRLGASPISVPQQQDTFVDLLAPPGWWVTYATGSTHSADIPDQLLPWPPPSRWWGTLAGCAIRCRSRRDRQPVLFLRSAIIHRQGSHRPGGLQAHAPGGTHEGCAWYVQIRTRGIS